MKRNNDTENLDGFNLARAQRKNQLYEDEPAQNHGLKHGKAERMHGTHMGDTEDQTVQLGSQKEHGGQEE